MNNQSKIKSINVLGVKMIPQTEVAKIIGTDCRATASEWLARAGLSGIAIKKTKYYSLELIKDYLRYERLDVRAAIEVLREIKMLKQVKEA